MEKKNERLSKGVRNIIVLGLVSCFADISSEMVYPLIPLYLTAAFGPRPCWWALSRASPRALRAC